MFPRLIVGRSNRTCGAPNGVELATDYRRINAAVHYEMFSVFQVKPGALGEDRAAAIIEARTCLDRLADSGVTLRGLYCVAGLRADADWMWWTHADSIEALQSAYNKLRRSLRTGPGQHASVELGRHSPACRIQQDPCAGIPRR